MDGLPARTAPDLPLDVRDRFADLFARSLASTADYVLGAGAFTRPDDAPLAQALAAVRDEDHRHAVRLARLADELDFVPGPGAFAHWYRDLNYLSLAWLGDFTRRVLADDAVRFEALLADWPAEETKARGELEAILAEKRARLGLLAPAVVAALARERTHHESEIEARRASRAKVTAARDAAQKPPPAPGKPKPTEKPAEKPVDAKEKARLAILAQRKKQQEAASAAAPAGVPDPNEPGIDPKEKARRQILAMRAKKAGGAAPVPAPSAPAAAAAPAVLDPDEPGITAKEKARRQILKMRAEKVGVAPKPEPAKPKPEELPDPDEPGIDPKEKARRQVLRMRAGKPPQAAPAPKPEPEAPEADALPDPDEPGIDPKEKARRQVLRMRAQRKKGEA